MTSYSHINMPDGCQDWITCLQQGEEKALEYFYGKYHQRIYHFVLKIVKNEKDTEDILQESILKLWESREDIESEKHLENFFYLVAGQGAIRCLRQRGKDNLLQKELQYLRSEAEIDLERERITSSVLELQFHDIETLPPVCKEIFKQFYFEKKTTKEIAEKFGITTQTVLNQKTKAKNKLKALFLRQKLFFVLLLVLGLMAS
jgi:RNA polymerase sigma factor (sigma-70 family)